MKHVYPAIVILITVLAGACMLPRVGGDGQVSPDDTEFVVYFPKYVARLIESKGWDEPDPDVGAMWLTWAAWFIGLTALAAIVWYLTHLREAGGVAAILGLFAICCAGMAEVPWHYVGAGIVALVVLGFVGYKLKDFSLTNRFRKHKQT